MSTEPMRPEPGMAPPPVLASRTTAHYQRKATVRAVAGRLAVGGTASDLSIVVPTRNEAANVASLVANLHGVMGAGAWEVIFVDDSDDATPEVIESLGNRSVRLMHRPVGQRAGGLASAVAEGFKAAKGSVVAVMDGDLQHDPLVLPVLLRALATCDVAIASRFVSGGGGSAGLSGPLRVGVSAGASAVVRTLFPLLRGVHDPLSGFFALRRSVIEGAVFRPTGYKILLEVLIRGHWSVLREVPFAMAPRRAGASNAGTVEAIRFARHVARLRVGGSDHRRPCGCGAAVAG